MLITKSLLLSWWQLVAMVEGEYVGVFRKERLLPPFHSELFVFEYKCGLLDIRSQKVETLVPLPIDLQEGKGAHISCLSLLGSLWEYLAWSCLRTQKTSPKNTLDLNLPALKPMSTC